MDTKMKILRVIGLFLPIYLFSIAWAYAQVANSDKNLPSEGMITYQLITNVHALLGPGQQAMKALVPEERESSIEVAFDKNRYLIEDKKEGQNSLEKTIRGNEVSLVNTDAGTQTAYGVMSDVNYFISSEIQSVKDLALSGKTKKIHGFNAHLVTGKLPATVAGGELREVEIWYTKEIMSSASPIAVNGVGGAILDLNIDSGIFKYTTQDIQTKPVSQSIFELPSDYIEVTQEQLSDLREEVLESITGSGANVIRR